jgi:predicted DCC family thiol-disulfide oxidoreductase YuxK
LKHPIVIFDGVCNLCNGAVQFIIKFDKGQNLRFASFQSPEMASFLASKNISSIEPQTILFLKDGSIFDKSRAIYEILDYLPRLKFLRFLFFLPETFNNKIYDFVARNRYRVLGKRDTCMLPTENQKKLFEIEI